MRSVSDINDQFDTIAIAHEQIRAFYTNSVEEMDIDKMDVVNFPFLYAQVTSATVEKGVTSFDYDIIVADLVTEEQLPTLDEVYTSTFLILQDVIALLDNSEVDVTNFDVDRDYGIELPVQCTPFTSRFNNLLTGWTTQLTIRVPNPLNACYTPGA